MEKKHSIKFIKFNYLENEDNIFWNINPKYIIYWKNYKDQQIVIKIEKIDKEFIINFSLNNNTFKEVLEQLKLL